MNSLAFLVFLTVSASWYLGPISDNCRAPPFVYLYPVGLSTINYPGLINSGWVGFNKEPLTNMIRFYLGSISCQDRLPYQTKPSLLYRKI